MSAIKVDGRRAYDRVRAGEQVELAARPVRGRRDRRRAASARRRRIVDVDVSVRCSSGTYVRAIARDLGRTLGVGGHLTALRRTAVGPFDLDARAHARRSSSRRPRRACRSREAARAAFPASTSTRSRRPTCASAASSRSTSAATARCALFAPDGEFLALYEQDGDIARAVAVFV